MENINKEFDLLDSLDFSINEEIKENFDIIENLNIENNTEKQEDILVFENFTQEEKKEEIDILSEYESSIIKETNSIKSKAIEIWKITFWYITTSWLIFLVLIIGTNYSAYYEIAKSYINADDLKKANADMISSIDSTKITEEAELNSAKNQEDSESKNYHSMTKMLYEAQNEKINLDIDISPYENRIIIPKIWKNIPLVNVENKQVTNVKELEDVFMEELAKWVIRYPGSWIPGEEWNMFVFWHSSNFPWIKWDYNDVFAILDKVVFNDEVIVYYWQKKYIYKIREKTVIKPGDVSILKRNKWKSEITLMTCYPIGTSINRLLVIWELVKE